MIFLLSWRNVWRNKKRSITLLVSIALGLWAGILIMALFYGMTEQMVRSAIESRIGHIQVHAAEFSRHREITLTIPDGPEVLDAIRAEPGVRCAAGRAVVSGMASSAVTGTGMVLYGIIPGDELRLTDIRERLVEGDYFESITRNPCVIGSRLAEKLNLKLGRKIIVTAQGMDGSIAGGAFRIVGLFKTVNSMFDKTAVFAMREDVDRLFELHGEIHEIVVRSADLESVGSVQAGLKKDFPGLDIENWKQLEPDLGVMADMSRQMSLIFMIIVLLAMIFGITNTMLMTVLERIREIGVLAALGMKHRRIFMMIMLEAVFLSIIGGVTGILMGYVTVAVLARTGLNLSMVSQGLAAMGADSILYPRWQAHDYLVVGAMVVVTAIVAAIYPGVRAARLNPVEAIRTY
jgi:ABC-type lipoprotein release transport system permease subunit